MDEDVGHSSGADEELETATQQMSIDQSGQNSWEEDSSSSESSDEANDSEEEQVSVDKTDSINASQDSDKIISADHIGDGHTSESSSNSEQDSEADGEEKEGDGDDDGGEDKDDKSNGEDDDSADDDNVNLNTRRKATPRNKFEQKIWEENPDIYGIRRSSRTRKEPERLNFQSESDSDDSSKKRSNRNKKKREKGWIPTLSDSESDDTDSSYDAPRKKPQRGKPKAQRGKYQRGRNISTSSSDNWKSKNKGKRSKYSGSRRANVNKVSYKEDSGDDSTDSDDLLDDANGSGDTYIALDVETIEKIMRSRQGRVGETGAQTTIYAVEAEEIAALGEIDPATEETEPQYLIKWKGWSHLHNTWESKDSLVIQNCNGMKKLENYVKKMDEVSHWKKTAAPEDVEYYEYQIEMNQDIQSQYLKVERIIAHQFTAESTSSYPDYYCKWQGLAYADCTWEDGALAARFFQNEIDVYLERERSDLIPVKNAKCLRNRPKFTPFKSQPEFLGNNDLQLRDYQLDGVNWLVHAWIRETSVILADEMGLGKTIQSISFLSSLFFSHSLYGPFLIVVPLSTLDAWQREFHLWSPAMNVIVYIGDVNSRTVVREHEWYLKKTKKIKFNALITTYEILLRDKDILGSLNWACLLVDEAHRLKNEDSLLYRILIDFHTNFRVLITGTPLQNSLKELWSLMHFIMPGHFQDWAYFDSQYSVSDKEGLQKLHHDLEPYLLRRVKKDVEKSLPSKVEQILRVEMSQAQKQLYKLILTRNVQQLFKELQGSFSGLLNIIVELKKCCNHSHLIKPAEEMDDSNYLQVLIRGSGKMILLDKLLCRLKETGHRVLIFSQMVRLLDILADYLYLKKFQFQRLDGSIKGETRQRALDHFNAEGSPDFCFLLSTRAGGLGINLASADTVIIFDSDWNPQNDLQAMARAHRIGQKNKVSIYRFVTKGSIEEDIIERAKKKMVLDHLVIQQMDTTGRRILSKSKHTHANAPFNKEELSSILKFGAEELFKEHDNDSDQKLQAMDIDEILQHAETQDTQNMKSVGDDLLSQFKVVNYASFAEEEIKEEPVTIVEKLWEEIIPEEERKKMEEKLEEEKKAKIDLKPRNRKTVEKTVTPKKEKKSQAFVATDSSSSSDISDIVDDDEEIPKSKKIQKKKPAGKILKKEGVSGFTDAEIRRFVKSYKKFARPMTRLDSIAEDAELNEKSASELSEVAQLIKSSCELAVKEYQERLLQDEQFDGKKKGATVRISGVTVNAPSVLKAEVDLEPLATSIPSDSTEQLSYRLTVPTRSVHWGLTWGPVEDSMLLLGMLMYGVGNWDAIKNDPKLQLTAKILPIGNGKPQDKHLQSRADYLLKLLKEQSSHHQKIITKKHKKSSSDQKQAKHHHETSNSTLEDKEHSQAVVKEEKVAKKRKSKPREKSPKKEKKREKKTTKSSKVPVEEPSTCITTVVDEVNLDEATFESCKEKMRNEKKSLNSLRKPDESLSEKEQVQNTKRCLLKIGDHIEKCLDDYNNNPNDLDTWRNNLWSFVARFTVFGPSKLHKLYRTAVRKRNAVRDEQKREIQKLKTNYSNSLHELGKKLPHERLDMEETRKKVFGIDTVISTKIPKLDRIKKIPHKKKAEEDHENSFHEDSLSHQNNDDAKYYSNRKQERNQYNDNWNPHHRHGEHRKPYRKGGGDERYYRHNHPGANDENSGGKMQTYREWKESQNRDIPHDEKPQLEVHTKTPYRDKQVHGEEKNIRKTVSGTLTDPRNRKRLHADIHDNSEYLKSPISSTYPTESWSRKRTLSNNSDVSASSLTTKQTVREVDLSPNSNQSWPASGSKT